MHSVQHAETGQRGPGCPAGCHSWRSGIAVGDALIVGCDPDGGHNVVSQISCGFVSPIGTPSTERVESPTIQCNRAPFL